MCLAIFRKIFNGTSQCRSVLQNKFEKEMEAAIQKSAEALQELSIENMSSETLRAYYMPNFKPKTDGHLMAISAGHPNQPVEVGYRINNDAGLIKVDIFTTGNEETILGTKCFYVTDKNGKMEMCNGSMASDEDACKQVGVKGIGTLEDILQVKYAIENGINRIPSYARAYSTLFHLKMGFKPLPLLERIQSLGDVEKIISKMINEPGSTISSRHYTPIIVSKGTGKKEYFLDTNTTQCIANIRQIKDDYKKGLCCGARPFIQGRGVDMTLEGDNFSIWKQMIEKMFSNASTTLPFKYSSRSSTL